MHVYEQEAVSIIGRNGAGKTTTLRSIMGLTPPRSGNIVIDTRGEIVNNLTTRQLEENPEIVQSHLSI
ncbi:ATP-binding cassette domain-containing protein [uncultured Desulfobacter sp.]|uniref:ATP-binding cassette domain-containing protein n=1 Tax=uncultured Desulfobacter sp. TaxID=240139 RepID=UPI0029F59243|nr:ATP-binding cassette domain-containing protein [uncultured Desulfobacter sp.]